MVDTGLNRKLGVKAGDRVAAVNAPEGYVARLGPPADVTVSEDLDGRFEVVHLFARTRAEVDAFAPAAQAALEPGGRLWISYPKVSAGVDTDLRRDVFLDALTPLGLRPVTQISVDETWSALRFRPIAEVKSARAR